MCALAGTQDMATVLPHFHPTERWGHLHVRQHASVLSESSATPSQLLHFISAAVQPAAHAHSSLNTWTSKPGCISAGDHGSLDVRARRAGAAGCARRVARRSAKVHGAGLQKPRVRSYDACFEPRGLHACRRAVALAHVLLVAVHVRPADVRCVMQHGRTHGHAGDGAAGSVHVGAGVRPRSANDPYPGGDFPRHAHGHATPPPPTLPHALRVASEDCPT